MRKSAIVLLTVTALAVPNVEAYAATKAQKTAPKKKVVTVTQSFTGVPGSADRWGEVQVTIVVKKTTTTIVKTKKKTVTRRISSVSVPVYPNHTSRSIFINQQALPYLVQETLQAQGANIDMVSGATYTSQGFETSLQSAVLKEKAA
ncbi:MAG TPA: FMN-binding protein [Gaiellaceae bacterium]|jgi:uncharacterized protein with FMN-binding domain|nr:FMN-binding protein [Gaiellaceae bacterium]